MGLHYGRILNARPKVHLVGKDAGLSSQHSCRSTWEVADARWETSLSGSQEGGPGLGWVCLQREGREKHWAMQNARTPGKWDSPGTQFGGIEMQVR